MDTKYHTGSRAPRAVAAGAAAWALLLAGCVGEFLNEAQIEQKIDAWQKLQDSALADSLGVDANGADAGDANGADADDQDSATDLDATEDSDASAVDGGDADDDGGDADGDGGDADDGSADGADALCPGGGVTETACNGVDDDCDGDTDEVSCDDGNPCTGNSCKEGSCASSQVSGTCDDGNPCTKGDACLAGLCTGQAVACDDQEPCTVDACALSGPKVGSCEFTPLDGAACSDDNPCTIGDGCKDGACKAGGPKSCNSGDSCVNAACSPEDGKCKFKTKADGSSCSDGNACTSGDACELGVCAGAAVVCQDNNACTNDACDLASGCTYTTTAAACDDGSACTVGDACKDGACVAGSAVVCDDNNACSKDSCDAKTGKCSYVIGADACDDGNACTKDDSCITGVCAGVAQACDDKNPCTDDACDPASGCKATPNVAVCDDKNACTSADACSAGLCKGKPNVVCDDGNPCTTDACDPAAGCKATAHTSACDDGNPCTTGDKCAGGACQPGAIGSSCECKGNSDCKPLDDDNLCNGSLFCDTSAGKGQCKVNPSTVVTCSTSGDSACAINTCSPTSGSCALQPQAEGKPCDADGSVCTVGDVCAKGLCKAGTAQVCDDKNLCTNDSCDAKAGCVHLANTAACDADGSACTEGDACSGKVCTAGKPKVCDDKNPCTSDACDAKTGACSAPANSEPCEDGDLCTSGDKCAGGACKAGAAKVCDDKNPCTSDACEKTSGGCSAAPKSGDCSDGDGCTLGDACASGVCKGGSAKDCDDKNPCTADSCDAKTGTCSTKAQAGACSDGDACTEGEACAGGKCAGGKPKVCDDKNVCTDDACDGAKGTCAYTPNAKACDDGNACTTGDACDAGVCKAGAFTCACTVANQTEKCNDNNACTADVCVQQDGKMVCQNNPSSGGPCSDGNPCTTNDICDAGACVVTGVVNCDDKNPCTVDACDKATGKCTNTGVTTALTCDDGNPCTEFDACNGAVCKSGTPKVCNDSKVCTSDACDQSKGTCVFTNNTAPCDDGNACTAGDVCASGTCKAGTPKVCNDSKGCTDDSCDTASGACKYLPNAAACSDSDPCTVGDICASGACKSGTTTVCNDNNPCTSDSCNKADGKCAFVANTGACTDNDACTVGDICANSACKPGTPQNCNDNNVCTDDSCDKTSGQCAYVANTKACDDGNKCTAGDVCAAKACKAGAPVTCNDSNPCTDDSCVPATGACSFNPNAKSCDDTNACTAPDACQSGSCVPGPNVCACQTDTNCNDNNACTKDTCVTGGDGKKSCTNVAVTNGTACSDGNGCTQTDTCQAGTCVGANPKVCNDSNVCTADSCKTSDGTCTYAPVTGTCSDNNACTENDTCQSGACKAGTPKVCNDSNPCTNDACDASQSGTCTFTNNAATCTDNNLCTSPDVCNGGVCRAGQPKSCDDANVCTADSCDAAKGDCEHAAIPLATCSDGNLCTLNDLCEGTQCLAGTPKPCTDDNPCTDDKGCQQVTGNCKYDNNTADCNDGSLCTETDTCSLGTCVGAVVDCDDKNPCTQDTCKASAGCINDPVSTGACSDGNLCTHSDACNKGVCKGTNVNCHDSNTCTSDTCDKGICVYAAKTGQACGQTTPCIVSRTCNEYAGCDVQPYCWEMGKFGCQVRSCTSFLNVPMCGTVISGANGCDDDNACTADSCGLSKLQEMTCGHVPVSEGMTCNAEGFTCQSGMCLPNPQM